MQRISTKKKKESENDAHSSTSIQYSAWNLKRNQILKVWTGKEVKVCLLADHVILYKSS